MKEIQELFCEVLKEVEKLGIPISKNINSQIIINKRAKSRFGCCKKIRNGLSESFEIEISNRLLTCESKAIKQILAHEILHTCKGCANHGDIWKNYAEKMNEVYGYNIKRTDTAEQLGINAEIGSITKMLPDNYIIICKKCGSKVTRTRMSKVIKTPSAYRCKCGGKLERVK